MESNFTKCNFDSNGMTELALAMEELSTMIEAFNKDLLPLSEEEISAINLKRSSLLRKYYANFFPGNIIPLF